MSGDIRKFNKINNFLIFSFTFLFSIVLLIIYLNFSYPHQNILNLFYEKCIRRCFEIISTNLKLFLTLKYILIFFLLTLFVYSLIKTLYKFFKAYAYSKSLEKTDFPSKIKRIIKDLSIKENRIISFKNDFNIAFTSGLIFPKIYVSTGLIESLNEEEIKAVLLHEKSHLKRKDPLKSIILYFFSSLFSFLPVSKNIFSIFKRCSEFMADDYALNFSGPSLNLASSLLKIKKNNIDSVRNFINFYKDEFINERLERLLNIENKNYRKKFPVKKLILSIFIYFFLILSIFPYEKTFHREVNHQADLSYKCFCCEMKNSNTVQYFCHR
ncbi:MAG: M56 family metallopeptidase [Acidobacteriota bacterium]